MPLAGLAGLAPPGRVDVRMTLGSMPPDLGRMPDGAAQEFYVSADLDERGEPNIRVSRLLGGKYFRVAYSDRTVIIVDAQGSRVWATWPDAATVEDTATYLLGPILGFVLRLRGVTCLHASAVAIDGRAIALVGPSGAGKSSLAAAFAQRRHPVLADDVVALSDQGDCFEVQPAYPRLRLWPESVKTLFGSSEALPRITPGWDKRFLDLNGRDCRFQREPLPLAALYFLTGRCSVRVGPAIEAISPRASLMTLVSDTYATRLLDAPRRAQEFELLGRLVANVPSRRATLGADFARTAELCEAIVDDFRKRVA